VSLIGIPVGIYGYLFPANINIMVMELYATKKYRLLIFLLGLILVFETFYCIAALSFLNVLKNNHQLYSSIELVAYVLIFVMGLWMVAEKKNDNKITQRNTLFRGIFNIIIHPQQIPFWVVAGILLSKVMEINIHNSTFDAFVLFNAIGTLLAMLLYMYFGIRILNYFKLNIAMFNRIMGAGYILLALYHWLLA
jgi:hypothetical protein